MRCCLRTGCDVANGALQQPSDGAASHDLDGGVVVQVRHALSDVAGDAEEQVQVQPARPLRLAAAAGRPVDEAIEAAFRHEREHDGLEVRRAARGDHADEVPVPDAPEHPALPLEAAGDHLAAADLVLVQDFDGDHRPAMEDTPVDMSVSSFPNQIHFRKAIRRIDKLTI